MEVQASRLVAAVPDRVMRALTAGDELTQWACEQAEVSQGEFRLKGISLPTGSLGGRVMERDGSQLRFEWPLGDGVSEVVIQLEAVPQSGNPPADFTRISVTHRGIPAGILQARWPEESWGCFWSLWLRYLKGWVERAEVADRFSFAGAFGLSLERSLELEAPPSRVWLALTQPELRQRWLGVPLGQELAREEGRLLRCTFELEQASTILTWRLDELPGGRTRLTLQEEGVTWEGIDNHLGWHDYLVALQQEVAPPLIRQALWIAATPERIWPYVATQEGLRRWFSSNIRFEPRVGSSVSLEAHGGRLSGRVTAVEPPRRLSFSWTEEGVGWPEPEPLLITIELLPKGEGCWVRLTHSGFENLPEAIRLKEFGGYQRGWAPGESLVELRAVVLTGEQISV